MRGAKPRTAAAEAKAMQRKTLDIAHELYPGESVKLVRNHRGAVHLVGVQHDACVLVKKDGEQLVALLFDSSWARLYALAVDVRRDRARAREASECQ